MSPYNSTDSTEKQSVILSDLAITDLVITEILLYRTLYKALSSQSHLTITDKLKLLVVSL